MNIKGLLSQVWDTFALLSLPIGMALAYFSPGLAVYMARAFSIFIEVLVAVSPFVVPVILPPIIVKALKMGNAGRLFLLAIFVGIIFFTFLAAIYSSLFLGFVFGLPVTGGGEASLSHVSYVLERVPFFSPFFVSIYITLVFILVSYFSNRLRALLDRSFESLMKGFDFLDIITPVIVFFAGAYLLRFQMPEVVDVQPISVLPFKADALHFYILSIVLTAVITFSFLLLPIIVIKGFGGSFPINGFLRYTARIFPFSWLSSSEIATVPVSLKWSRKHLGVEKTSSSIVIPIVGILQSTEIALTLPIYGILAAFAVGVEVPLLTLVIYSCTIFIIFDFVVVGIPSEVALLAVPLSQILPIPEAQVPAFIAIVVALQAGIPDSFRTAGNVAFGGLYSVLMEKIYRRLSIADNGA